jgi:hypothetical protein
VFKNHHNHSHLVKTLQYLRKVLKNKLKGDLSHIIRIMDNSKVLNKIRRAAVVVQGLQDKAVTLHRFHHLLFLDKNELYRYYVIKLQDKIYQAQKIIRRPHQVEENCNILHRIIFKMKVGRIQANCWEELVPSCF